MACGDMNADPGLDRACGCATFARSRKPVVVLDGERRHAAMTAQRSRCITALRWLRTVRSLTAN